LIRFRRDPEKLPARGGDRKAIRLHRANAHNIQLTSMDVQLRGGTSADAEECGTICYEAFKTISQHHNFPPDFPSVDAARAVCAAMLSLPHVYSVVAESKGRIVGSNFLWEESSITGVGPITIAPDVQNSAVGRMLMDAVLERARSKGAAGVRLIQAAFHNRSMALYTKLGFDVQEPLANMQGPALGIRIPGYAVRAARQDDLASCNELCRRIHGHERAAEMQYAIHQQTARVVEHDGRITGYATVLGFFGHAVGETNEDLKALIGAAESFPGPGFLLPSRNGELFRWCLQHRLRIVQPATLMSLGLYNKPTGAFLPSILY
jgi:N-acetylglutamate synthase-like GNAT family acetyltransferase